jgi:hypothetical protein
MKFPGNPHALFNNGVITEIFYAGDNTREEMDRRLADLKYDHILSFEEYGRELFVGEDILEDGFVRPIPLAKEMVWNYETNLWEYPTPRPVEEGKKFYWDVALASWKEDTTHLSHVVGNMPVVGNCCSTGINTMSKESINAY